MTDQQPRADAPATAAAREICRAISAETLRDLMHARETRVFRGIVAEPAAILSSDHIRGLLATGTFPAAALRTYARRRRLDGPTMGYVRDGVVQAGPLEQLIAQGVTLAINDLTPHLPRLRPAALVFAEWLQDAVELNCFASFGSGSGLPIHHDQMHLLLVQLEGHKRWQLHGPPVPIGSSLEPGDDVAGPVSEVVTSPGDVLFLPAGQRHSAAADGASLHLGIMPAHVTGKIMLRRLVAREEDDPALREPAVGLMGPQSDSRMVAEWRARLHALVDQYDFAGELEIVRAELAARQNCGF